MEEADQGHHRRPGETPGTRVRPSSDDSIAALLGLATAMTDALELTPMLRQIVATGTAMVGADYGAIGIIGTQGTFTEVVHTGVSASEVQRIGAPPQGLGLLGEVISSAHSIRVDDLRLDPRSHGLPDHHPQMGAFLGVPIRIRNHLYGDLYVTRATTDGFTAEDQETLEGIAAIAGITIENAQLLDEAHRRQRWSTALAEVSSALLSHSADEVMGLVADRIASLVGAARVSVHVPGPGPNQFTVHTARGLDATALEGIVIDGTGSVVAAAFAERVPVLTEGGQMGAPVPGVTPVGPIAFVPVLTNSEPFGVLGISRPLGAPPLSFDELSLVSEFAKQTSIGIELARAQADSRQLELLELRNQIARDLHDHVIQRLFGTGLLLQGMLGRVDDDVKDEVAAHVESLDHAIAEIRTAVFALRTRAGGATDTTIRHRVFDVLRELTPMLPKAPLFTTTGPVDLFVAPDLGDDVTAVVRELLTNVVKHAQATSTSVNLTVRDGWLSVQVEDDGIGIADSGRNSGISSLGHRAENRGGNLTVTGATPHGTIARWSVPLEMA